MKVCEFCGSEFEEKYPKQRFCSRACYFAFKKTRKTEREGKKSVEEIPVETEVIPIVPIAENITEEAEVPKKPQKTEKPKIVALMKKAPEGYCQICGSPMYCGRCVRFTQHKKLKK